MQRFSRRPNDCSNCVGVTCIICSTILGIIVIVGIVLLIISLTLRPNIKLKNMEFNSSGTAVARFKFKNDYWIPVEWDDPKLNVYWLPDSNSSTLTVSNTCSGGVGNDPCTYFGEEDNVCGIKLGSYEDNKMEFNTHSGESKKKDFPLDQTSQEIACVIDMMTTAEFDSDNEYQLIKAKGHVEANPYKGRRRGNVKLNGKYKYYS